MKTVYKGAEIEISDHMHVMDSMADMSPEKNDTEPEQHHGGEHQAHNSGVKIDGKDAHVIDLKDGTYVSHYFPYIRSDSKLEVAKQLIDYVSEFGGKAYEDDDATKKE